MAPVRVREHVRRGFGGVLYVLASLAFGFGLTLFSLCWWADASVRELWAFTHPALRPTLDTRRKLNDVEQKLAHAHGEIARLERVFAARNARAQDQQKHAATKRTGSAAPTQTFKRIHNRRRGARS